MARHATIVDRIKDLWGDEWDVREYRPTGHGFPVALGWPTGVPRGRGGSGGPRAVLTEPVVIYLAGLRDSPQDIRLPIGRTTLKRLRRALGHHWRVDRAAWWEARVEDLSDLTLTAFAAKHGVSVASASHARSALYGRMIRAPGWWQAPDVVEIILSDMPRAVIAEQLDVSVGTIGRLRWLLRQETAHGD